MKLILLQLDTLSLGPWGVVHIVPTWCQLFPQMLGIQQGKKVCALKEPKC